MANSFAAGYDGASWFLVMDALCPSADELASFLSETPLEIRFSSINNIIFFSLKYPGEPPIDAPFTPHWDDPKPFHIVPPTSNMGYALQYVLRPSRRTRLIGLGHDFSVALYDAVIAAYNAPFSSAQHQRNINDVYSRFTTNKLWNNAPLKQRYVVGTTDIPAAPSKIYDGIALEELVKIRGEYDAEYDTVCVYCIPNRLREFAVTNPADHIVPIPVAYLRDKGYRVDGDYIYIDVPYDDVFGVVMPDEYYG